MEAAEKQREAAAAAGEQEAVKAADEQVKAKRNKVIAMEQAAGRTGGDTGRRIIYDDAAIDRLLDR